MTTFHVITLFPESLRSYLETSVLARAIGDKKIGIKFHNLKDYAEATAAGRKLVDDRPFGGGAGMVLKAEPILKAVKALKLKDRRETKVVLLSAKGKPFNQKLAHTWAKKYKKIVFIAGRYEGIDERAKLVLRAEEVSLGPFVLTDGEVAATAMISATARLIPGVIKLESLAEESHWNLTLKNEAASQLEYPHYTRPEVLEWQGKKYRVPKILLSGHHQKISEWRHKQSKK